MPFVIYGLMFGSAAILGLAAYPPMVVRIKTYLERRAGEAKFYLEDMFLDLSQHRLQLLYGCAPVGLALFAWLSTGMWPAGIVGAALGLVVPKLFIRYLHQARRKKFNNQLVDGLLLLSSCLRAGLSMLQSFTVVAEEMPPPISQEFGLLLKETRMGVNLEEAMMHLKQRMPSDDTNLLATAILVARETGGDITSVFSQLVETIRERKKIKERIKTLTFMARMQGIIMSLLPIAFSYVVYTIDKNHFKFFLTDPTGKMLLAGVVALQLFGASLFMRFSKSPL